jgi:hypothetical protein
MANYIDFVVAASKDKALAKEFAKKIDKSTPEELSDWYKSKGFSLSEEECKKMIDNKDVIKKSAKVQSY